METVLSIVVPTVLVSTIIAARALRMQRPVPGPFDRVKFLRHCQFKTGDIVLFHCNPFITTFGDGPWSHVAIVVIGRSGIPRLFEITGSGKCEAAAKPLRPCILENLMKGDHVVAFRRIHPAPDEERIRNFAMECIRKRDVYDHFYWATTFQRIFSWCFPINMRREHVGENTHICSSIIADALAYADVLKPNTNTVEILPSDFASDDGRLSLRSPYRFGPLHFLRLRV